MENTWKEKYILFYEKNNQRIQMVMWALFIASLIFPMRLTLWMVTAFVSMSVLYFACKKQYSQIIFYLMIIAVLVLAPRLITIQK